MTCSLLSIPLLLVLTDSLLRYLEKIAFLFKLAERNKELPLTNVLQLQVKDSTDIQCMCMHQIYPNLFNLGGQKKEAFEQ